MMINNNGGSSTSSLNNVCPHLRTKTFGGIGSSHVDAAGIAAVKVFEILITERGGVR
jgi:hypothetical protein